MVHHIISSSNWMLLCCLGFFLLITEALILVDWGPTVTKQEHGVQIASIIVVYVLVFVAWILLGRPGILHGMQNRIQVFIMLLSTFIFTINFPILYYIHREIVRTIYCAFLLITAYEVISFAIFIMVVLALSLTVWPTSFVPEFLIRMFRRNPSQVVGYFEENWWRNTPFSTVEIFGFQKRKYCDMVKLFATLTDALGIFWRQKQQPETQR